MANGQLVGLTGGRGFIGSTLKKYLSEKGVSVVDYDCELSNFSDVESMILKLGVPDIMIHLAGRFSDDEYELLRDNLFATRNLLEVLSQYDGVRFVFGSTGAVYGNSGQSPIIESHACRPNTSYGRVKFWCEKVINHYEKSTTLSATILRFPSVYGPGNSKGVIYHWLHSSQNDYKIIINGDGLQSRSFVHVADICSAIFKIITLDIVGTFNISEEKHYDLEALSSIFIKNFNCELIYKDADNDLESMVLDSSLFIEKSSWFPSYDVGLYVKNFHKKQVLNSNGS